MDKESMIMELASIYNKPYKVVLERILESSYSDSLDLLYQEVSAGKDPLNLYDNNVKLKGFSEGGIAHRPELVDFISYNNHGYKLSTPAISGTININGSGSVDDIKAAVEKALSNHQSGSGVKLPEREMRNIKHYQRKAEKLYSEGVISYDYYKQMLDNLLEPTDKAKTAGEALGLTFTESKFKKGDKVRVTTDNPFNIIPIPHWLKVERISLMGMEGEITGINDGKYNTSINGREFWVTDNEIELIPPAFDHIQFKKEYYDLSFDCDNLQDREKPFQPLIIEWENKKG